MQIPILDPPHAPISTDSVRPLHQVKVEIHTHNSWKRRGNLPIRFLLDNYRCWVSDLLNNEGNFIPLTEVQLCDRDLKMVSESSFMCLNKQLVIFLRIAV